jgi:hypothetical protein
MMMEAVRTTGRNVKLYVEIDHKHMYQLRMKGSLKLNNYMHGDKKKLRHYIQYIQRRLNT